MLVDTTLKFWKPHIQSQLVNFVTTSAGS